MKTAKEILMAIEWKEYIRGSLVYYEDDVIKAMEEYASQFKGDQNKKSSGTYYCSVCHENPVDAENGYDTCSNCVNNI